MNKPKIIVANDIRLKGLSHEEKDTISRLHTVSNPQYLNLVRYSKSGYIPKEVPKYLEFFEIQGDDMLVPRGFDVDRYLPRFKAVKPIYKTVKAPASLPEGDLSLNKDQKAIMRLFKDTLYEGQIVGRTFLTQAPTSTGKSRVLFAQARYLGQRTLILCNNITVMRSWEEELHKICGITRKELGYIHHNRMDLEHSLVIGMMPTIARRQPYWKKIYKAFGTVILDETQECNNPSMGEFLLDCPAHNIITASATPYKDRHVNYNVRFLFDKPFCVIEESDRSTNSRMCVQSARVVPTAFKYSQQQDNVDFNGICEAIMGDADRNDLIVSNVIRDIDAGHIPLVVTRRVQHVHLLIALLEEQGVSDLQPITGDINADRFRRSMIRDQVFKGNVRGIVAVGKAIELGANMNPLSRLHITMPYASATPITQLIGRIRRRFDGKKGCEVFYYLDKEVPYLVSVYERHVRRAYEQIKVKKIVD